MRHIALTAALSLCALASQAQNSPEEKFNMAMYAVTNMYVDSVDKGRFVDEEIARMMRTLDPFSEYLPPATAKMNENALMSRPADAASGTSVNAADTTGAHHAARLAPAGFKTLKSSYMIDRQTGYICLAMFAESTVDEFRSAVADMRKKGMKNLVLDLRSNGGGLFDAAVALADEFLSGEKTVVSTQGAHSPAMVFKTDAARKGCMEKGRVILLVGDQTKSAAEIFTAAIRDWDRGVLVGGTTFGKGLIQETLPFSDGSALRITVARYLTPSGMSIQRPYNGMVFSDSTRVWHSLANNRPLTCTGGVSADIDVAPDTTYMTDWYTLITYAGVQTAVASKYVRDLRDKLLATYPTAEKFVQNFQTPDELMNAVRQTAVQAGIEGDETAMRRSDEHVRAQMKAVVCSRLFNDNNLYYRLFNSRQPELKRAMEIINGNEYDRILCGKR